MPSARRLAHALVLAAPLACVSAPALSQGLRGSLDTLPGASPDMSPYALGSAPETRFDPWAEAGLPSPDASITSGEDTAEGGTGEGGTGDAQPAGPAPLATPAPGRRPSRPSRRTPEEDPFAAPGIRAGSFILKPALELRGGYESNPNSYANPEGSAVGSAKGELTVESDWTRHFFRGRIESTYEAYDAFPELDGPSYAAEAALRLDVRRDLRVDMAFRSSLDRDFSGDPEFVGRTTNSENLRTGGTGGFVWKPNRLSVGFTGEVDRRTFGDEDLADSDYVGTDLRLRTGYELQPGLEPFVEIAGLRRQYDEPVNDLGFRHDSQGARVYAGLRLEPDPIWTVEAKVGYGHQEVEDPFFDDLDGVVGKAQVIWNPSALTELRLSAEREFEASTAENDPMAARWRAGVGFTHEFRRWLILTGDFSYEESKYENTGEKTGQYNAALGLEYKINRTFSALGNLTWEKVDYSPSGQGFDNTKIEIGLRAQR